MTSLYALAAQARRLNREVGGPPVPTLFFLTDPGRTPDPVAIAKRLPPETAVIYRHFGAADRAQVAGQLAAVARTRHLVLLIAADPDLADRTGAAGVHWPERLLHRAGASGLNTASAHSREGVLNAQGIGVDAILLGPVFRTRSGAGNPPLGLFRASQIARAVAAPVIALGGVTAASAQRLSGRGFAGVAAIDAFL